MGQYKLALKYWWHYDIYNNEYFKLRTFVFVILEGNWIKQLYYVYLVNQLFDLSSQKYSQLLLPLWTAFFSWITLFPLFCVYIYVYVINVNAKCWSSYSDKKYTNLELPKTWIDPKTLKNVGDAAQK